MRKNETVGVIGAGLGGLAAACVLAARGHKVVLIDKNPWLGGKAGIVLPGSVLVKAQSHAMVSPHPKSYSFAMTHLFSTESPYLNVGSY